MPITIPQSVFDKYYDVVDSTFNIFGVTCQLVYIEKVEVIDNSYNNIPDNRSINPHRRPGGGNYKRNNKTIKEVEKTSIDKTITFLHNPIITNSFKFFFIFYSLVSGRYSIINL